MEIREARKTKRKEKPLAVGGVTAMSQILPGSTWEAEEHFALKYPGVQLNIYQFASL